MHSAPSLLWLALTAAPPQAAAPPDGAALWAKHCSACHDKEIAARRPGRQELASMSSEAIVKAMTTGTMEHMAAKLTDAEKAAIAAFVGAKPAAVADPSAAPAVGRCSSAPAFRDPLGGPHWNGWGADPSNGRFQKAEHARLAKADVPRLALKWAFAFRGTNRAWGQPTVVGGRVFV